MAGLIDRSLDAWKDALGKGFQLRDAGADPLPLELVEVRALGEGGRSFSLLFRGADGTHWPQRIYRLREEGGAEEDLFVVPVGPDGEGRMRYEVLFSREA